LEILILLVQEDLEILVLLGILEKHLRFLGYLSLVVQVVLLGREILGILEL
jgi:hypothetical protein